MTWGAIRDWPLHRKISLLLVGLTAASSLVLVSGILVREADQLERNLREQVDTVADLLEPGIKFSLQIAQKEELAAALRLIENSESIDRAAIYGADGQLIVRFPEEGWLPQAHVGEVQAADGPDRLSVLRVVKFESLDNRQQFAALLLEARKSVIVQRFHSVLMQAAAALALLIGVLVLVSRRLVMSVSAPLLELAKVAKTIRADQNFTLRAERKSGDEVGELVVAFNDMLAQIQARDSEMAGHAVRLEAEVRRRTEELERTAQSLRVAKERAEASVEARSQFLANVSHEIRTPLNAILGMTDLVLGTQLDPEQQEYVATVKQSGDSLLSIIEEILDFAKIEAGKIELDVVEVDLCALINDIVRPLSVRAEAKGIDLVADISPLVPTRVHLDPLRVQQVLTNLIGNAIKFTAVGEVVLNVDVVDEHLEFRVVDTGIGIEANRLERVFEPFTQADGTTSRRFGGTGLGLTISRQLVALWGGRLQASSVFGRGSVFHFDVPLVAAQTEEPAVSLGDISVLLAMDLGGHARAIARALEAWGCRVVSSATGDVAELLDRVQQPFDVMLAREVGEGWSLANVKSRDGRANVLLVVSPGRLAEGMALIETRQLAGYVMWPFSRRELLRKLQQLLESGRRAPDAARVAPTEAVAGGVRRILVAEDNPINQRLVAAILGKGGHEFEITADGAACVEAYRKRSFDLVLMDMQMPGMDGVEAAHHIRDLEVQLGRRTPIVALTANATSEDRQRCEQAGMDGFLTKPIRPARLLEVIASHQRVDDDAVTEG
ncbi:MAG: response regulator [Planctomycetes bacterium]|nr:response regulator [Planctomycetota bacterium]